MTPIVEIKPGPGEEFFQTKTVKVSREVLARLAPDVILSRLNLLTGQPKVSDQEAQEITDLAFAMLKVACRK